MASFSYAALDGNGKELKGVIEADTSRQVRQILRDQGLAPLQGPIRWILAVSRQAPKDPQEGAAGDHRVPWPVGRGAVDATT